MGDVLTIFSGREDVPRFLQGADIMLHPAYMESGGIVLLEALVAGLPVIATDVCGFAHYIEEAQAGVLIPSPFEQEVLNQQLVRVMDDTAFRRRCASNGIQFGMTADIYRMPQRAADIIEDCVGG